MNRLAYAPTGERAVLEVGAARSSYRNGDAAACKCSAMMRRAILIVSRTLSWSNSPHRARVAAVLTAHGGPLWVRNAGAPVEGGMSGSPIVTDDGFAIGVVASGGARGSDTQQPVLADRLPGWLLRDLGLTEAGGPGGGRT